MFFLIFKTLFPMVSRKPITKPEEEQKAASKPQGNQTEELESVRSSYSLIIMNHHHFENRLGPTNSKLIGRLSLGISHIYCDGHLDRIYGGHSGQEQLRARRWSHLAVRTGEIQPSEIQLNA
jgi:galactose-1-phosphate uridylyltransferase